MGKNFEDEFMELQADFVSLCLEISEQKVNKIYIYCSIEKKSEMFNAFFEIDGKVKTLNQLGVSNALIMQFLKLGTSDLEKVKSVCVKHNMPVPTEMKMLYDAETGKYNAQYKYEEICSEKTGKSAGEVFLEWLSEVKMQR